ncbi:MAG TPA: hypothetical protein VFW22_16310 [Pseudolabrys sp.]|nr:hypothetical protein [Pseudolabrys sp.]
MGSAEIRVSGFSGSADARAVLNAPGICTIVRERMEQIDKHGFTLEHDLGHKPEDLGLAALAYLQIAISQLRGNEPRDGQGARAPGAWPWEPLSFHPGDVHANVAKAAAIAWALLDRLQDLPRADEVQH